MFDEALRTTVLWLAVFGIFGHARIAGAQTPQEFKAVGTEQVTAAIASFKAAIGGSDNGSATGSQGSGYRQITWDDVPDANATPAIFPKMFYDTIVPRGFLLGTSSGYNQFEVSAVEPNPYGAPALFAHRGPVFPTVLTTFSPGRIMRSAGADNAFWIDLKVPGFTEAASVSAFGAVFIDVDRENLTSFEFYDAGNQSLGTFFVPAAVGTKTVSFLGVILPPGGVRIAKVRIVPGYVHQQQPLDENDGRDLVALDDVIYAEPRRADAPTLTITSPTTNPTFAATGAFLTLGAVVTNTMTATWTDSRGRSGGFGRNAGETEFTDRSIPLDPGVTIFTVTATGPNGDTATDVVTVNSEILAYHLAEGSTGTFFDTDILIANPTAAPAPVTLTFLKEDGLRVIHTDTVAPMSRKTIHADGVPDLEAAAFSTTVVSTDRVPLVVERTMFWDAARYDGNGAAAVDPSRTWYFAEGVQNDFFDTFVLLQNPTETSANATLTFTRDFGEPPVVHHVPLPPLSRVTVDASTIPGLVGRSFGVNVEATAPIVAERSTYFESSPSRLWAGGHGSPGAPHLSTFWFFAEGATGDFRDTFLLLSNPGDAPTSVQFLFLTGRDRPIEITKTIEARSRLTIPVESLQAEYAGAPQLPLADAQFSVALFSGYPIVAERAMYWVGDPGPWADGTSTLGQTVPSKRWGFAEGRIGSPLGYHTYIRVANSHFQNPADVRITFLRGNGTQVVQTYTVPGYDFITVDVNGVPGLQDGDSVAAIVESTNGADIFTERSMYWNSGGVFWAGGLATAGTRLP